MFRMLLTLVLLSMSSLCAATPESGDQAVLDNCIGTWGDKSPFPKGTPAMREFDTGVTVFGLGRAPYDDVVTPKPSLILVRPAVNVMGKSTIRLGNPRGWYCFRSNTTVMGKITIDAICDAHFASAQEDGATVGAVDETNRGVTVFGALRVTRYGCKKKAGA
jgi:hypothetical protein